MQRLFSILSVIVITAMVSAVARSEPFATSFSFQSQLDKNGSPLNDTADCRFELFDAESGGVSVGTMIVVTNEAVVDGLLNVKLDFGVDVFDGSERWLEVSLRSPHDSLDLAPFTTLSPRQEVTPIPYALHTRGIKVDENEKVKIGVPANEAPLAKVQVRAEVADVVAFLAEAPGTLGDVVGVKGTTASANGKGVEGVGPNEGVRGHASATSGVTVGVRGKSDSANGTGVLGEATMEGLRGVASAASGVSRGVCGVSESDAGEGVLGHAMSKSGTTTGVKGVSDSPNGKGVVGQALGNGTGVVGQAEAEGVRGEAIAGTGVCGFSSGDSGLGVLGNASGGTGTTIGVKGMSDSVAGIGVMGEGVSEGVRGTATVLGGSARGVCGISASPMGEGVLGHNTAALGTPIGVRGITDSGGGKGVVGEAPNGGFGVWGETAGTGTGVRGVTNSSGFGVEGVATAMSGTTTAIYGNAISPQGTGVTGIGGTIGVVGLGFDDSVTSEAAGVIGQTLSLSKEGAGVRAIGNGTSGTSSPQGAALEISNGAINVSGSARPAGQVELGTSWTTVNDCAGDQIGYSQDVIVSNALITSDSMIWATVEIEGTSEIAGRAFAVHTFDKEPGSVTFRVIAFGRTGGPPMCSAPSGAIRRVVNYLVINPLSEP